MNWQDVVLFEGHDGISQEPQLPEDLLVSIQSWMFLNTVQADFNLDGVKTDIEDSDHPSRQAIDFDLDYQSDALTPYPQYLSPFRLGEAEGYLWSYFDQFMTPQIVIDPGFNPYRHIVLKLASCFREGPLFQCVLAAAANQLHSTGRPEYKSIMWLHRAKALRLLRAQIAQLASPEMEETGCRASKDQVIASTIMLTFFEVSVMVLISLLG